MYSSYSNGLVDITTFLNLVDNQINVQGIINAVNKNGGFKNNGHAVFISPKGMIVGPDGVINVGAMTALTPDQDSYEAYKRNVALPSLTAKWKEQLGHGTATVKMGGSSSKYTLVESSGISRIWQYTQGEVDCSFDASDRLGG